MFEPLLINEHHRFHTCAQIRIELLKVCKKYPELAQHVYLGKSRQKRVLDAFTLGRGPIDISLIAGAHADEPVGPETLRLLIRKCAELRDASPELFERFRFVVIPHINPDSEMANQRWIKEWPNLEAYLLHAARELPGDDIEFGFPDMRPENRCVASFLKRQPKLAMHMSLHGMGFSEGAMLLIDQRWIDRTKVMRERFSQEAAALGLGLHDHDRAGEKGFRYIGPGFTTTPEGNAMREFFLQQGHPEIANLFHDSSMDYVRTLSKEPLCLVTELPLFIVQGENAGKKMGVPMSYLAFREQKAALISQLMRGESIVEVKTKFSLSPMPLKKAIALQLTAIQLGLETVEHYL